MVVERWRAPRRRRAPTPARSDAARAGNGPRGRGLLAILFSRRNKRKSLVFHPAGSPGARGRTIRPLLPSSCRSSKERTPRSLGVLRDRSPEQKATLLLRRHHCSTTASRPRGRKPPAGSTSHPAGRRVRASARPPPAARPVAPRSHHGGGRRGGLLPPSRISSSTPPSRQRAPGVRGRGTRRHGGHRPVGHADHRARHLLPVRQRAPQAVGAAGDPVSARAVEATSLPLASTSSTSLPFLPPSRKERRRADG